MDASQTFARIKEIVSEQLEIDPSRVVPEADFIKDLDADSLDVVELVMAFEEAFEIDINDEVAGEIVTVQDALDYIEGNWKKG